MLAYSGIGPETIGKVVVLWICVNGGVGYALSLAVQLRPSIAYCALLVTELCIEAVGRQLLTLSLVCQSVALIAGLTESIPFNSAVGDDNTS